MNHDNVYSDLIISIRPSIDTNDYEVRFVADGIDLIDRYWPDMIGLDPDDLLLEPCPLRISETPHDATIARCNCGVVGCGSVEVAVSLDNNSALWRSPSGVPNIWIAKDAYATEVERAVNDFSWETPDRTAARLIRNAVDRAALSVYSLRFDWASGRIRPDAMTISLTVEAGPQQVLLHIPWDTNSTSAEAVAAECLIALAEPPKQWADVRVNGKRGAPLPSIAGPGWPRRHRIL